MGPRAEVSARPIEQFISEIQKLCYGHSHLRDPGRILGGRREGEGHSG
jgi:hypothetical protein